MSIVEWRIPFSKPWTPPKALEYAKDSLVSGRTAGDNSYTRKCQDWFAHQLGVPKPLFTPSCTHSLEMMALLLELTPDDEVIVPSFTFSSTANAFALRGAKIVFVDVDPKTMNMCPEAAARAISKRTRAIVLVHYAGISCDIEKFEDIKYGNSRIELLEDAAQCLLATFKEKPLGTIGRFGALSFHETKNISCGEGGALFVNYETDSFRAEIIREKGTNRSQLFRGEVDKYSWIDIGSSYLMNDLSAAMLYAQLERANEITEQRLLLWNQYFNELKHLSERGLVDLPHVPDYTDHNGHIFYLKLRSLDIRNRLISFLREKGIFSTFHYLPLHSSEAGRKYGRFCGEDRYTTSHSQRLLRLPLYYEMKPEQCSEICYWINAFLT